MEHSDGGPGKQNHYRRLIVMTILSFSAMYALMYAMVDRLANVHPNSNQFYMAGLMTAAMIIIELAVMGGMYPNKKLNVWLIVFSVVVFTTFWELIRQQTAISDRQFLKSMIPHHAGAILMCGRAPIKDPEVQKLCEGILLGQQREIDQMERILRRLDD
jgi:uncharacterized protein (DUF305 family)